MSAIFEGGSCRRRIVIIVYGWCQTSGFDGLNEDEVSRIVEKETMQLMFLKLNTNLFKIIRHNSAMPQYGVDSGVRFETVKMLEAKYKGLIIGGNLRNGIGMADRIKQGRELATSVIG